MKQETAFVQAPRRKGGGRHPNIFSIHMCHSTTAPLDPQSAIDPPLNFYKHASHLQALYACCFTNALIARFSPPPQIYLRCGACHNA